MLPFEVVHKPPKASSIQAVSTGGGATNTSNSKTKSSAAFAATYSAGQAGKGGPFATGKPSTATGQQNNSSNAHNNTISGGGADLTNISSAHLGGGSISVKESSVQSLSLHSRPHSRPVGGNMVGAQKPQSRQAFGLRGMATEQPLKFGVQPPSSSAVSSGGVGNLGATSTSASTAARVNTSSPQRGRGSTSGANNTSSPTKGGGGRHGSPVKTSLGKCYVNPNVKLTPSAQNSVAQGQHQHHLHPTSPAAKGNAGGGGSSSTTTPSKFASKSLIPAINQAGAQNQQQQQRKEQSGSGGSSFRPEALSLDALQDGPQGGVLQPASPERGGEVVASASGDNTRFTFDFEGFSVEQLASAEEILVDLKGYDLNEMIPRNNIFTCTVPKFKFPMKPPRVECQGIPISAATREPVVVEAFCQYIIDVNEVHMDRSLEYHVFTEVKDLFDELPSIEASTGTLTFVPAPGVSGPSKVHVRLADNASVNDKGEIMTSEPLTFEIEVTKAGKISAGVYKHHNHSQQKRALSPSQNSPQQKGGGGGRQLVQKTAGEIVSVSPDLSDGEGENEEEIEELSSRFSFARGSPHGLRFEGVQESHAKSFIAQGLDMKRKIIPCFSSVVCDVEKLKMVHSTQERDRLGGDASGQNTGETPADLEEKLREKIKREESLGAGSLAVELCPLLMRLGQILISQGASKHGDAIEILERICRIRLNECGMKSFEQLTELDPIAASVRKAELEHTNLTGNLSMFSPVKLPPTVSNNSILGIASPNAGSPEAPQTTSPASKPPEGLLKKSEALLQSLTVLATYFKLLGRFAEAIEFFDYAKSLAVGHFGTDSVQYARALSQLAEMNYYKGNYEVAIKYYEKAIQAAEVLFGPKHGSTVALIHLHAVCLVAIGNVQAGLEHHRKALQYRRELLEEDTDGSTEFALSESLAYLAQSEKRYGRTRDAAGHAEEALEILKQFDTSKSVEYTLSKCTILTVLAGVLSDSTTSTALNPEEGERASQRQLSLLDEAVSDASRVRGMDSVEGAILLVENAAAKIKYGGHAKALPELKYALSIFTSSLGPQHHYSARTQLLMAQCTLYEDVKQAKEFSEAGTASLRQNLSPVHRDVGVAYEMCGRIALVLEDQENAARLISAGYEIAVQSHHDSHLPELEVLLCGAYAKVDRPLPPKVFKKLEENLQLAKIENGETSDALLTPLMNMAEGHYLNGHFDRSHHCLSKALKIADSMNFIYLLGHLFKPATQLSVSDLHERNRIASDRVDAFQAHTFAIVLFGIGSIFEREGLYDDAQSTFLQAQAALEIASLPHSIGVVECLMALGRLLTQEGCYGDALAYFERGYNMLLEFHPTEEVAARKAMRCIHATQSILKQNGYTLVRHTDGRHRFASYL